MTKLKLQVQPVYVAARDAAGLLDMSESWFWGAVRAGKMPPGIRLGGKATRFEREAVLQAAKNFNLDSAEAGSSPPNPAHLNPNAKKRAPR